ncbi:hypothetical protein D3C72_2059670 [compost metagenome]
MTVLVAGLPAHTLTHPEAPPASGFEVLLSAVLSHMLPSTPSTMAPFGYPPISVENVES